MIVIYIMAALDMLTMSMFFPAFNPYILKDLGGSNFYIGCIFSSGSLIGLFWSPVVGSLGDTKGRRYVLIKCLSFSLVGNALGCIFSSLPLIFIARLICAFGTPVGIILRTMVNDVAETPDEKSAMYSKMGIIMAVFFMVGALLSGFLTEVEHGFDYVFIIITLIVLVNLGLAIKLPETKKQNKTEDKSEELTLLQSFNKELTTAVTNLKSINWARYKNLFIIKGCAEFCMGMMQSSMGLVLNGVFGLFGRNISFVFIIISLCNVITNLGMLKLKKRFYPNDVGYTRIAHSLILSTITYFGLGLTQNLYVFVVFIATMCISKAAMDVSVTEALTSKTKEDSGSVMSAFETAIPLTGLVSPLLAGHIADTYSIQLPLLLNVIPSAIGAYMAFREKDKTD